MSELSLSDFIEAMERCNPISTTGVEARDILLIRLKGIRDNLVKRLDEIIKLDMSCVRCDGPAAAIEVLAHASKLAEYL